MESNDALARELHALADKAAFVGALDVTNAALIHRAADALEAKLAAKREALIEAIHGTDDDWVAAGPATNCPMCQKEADALFASGALVRVPTREELVHRLYALAWVPSSAANRGDVVEVMADAVLALFESKEKQGA